MAEHAVGRPEWAADLSAGGLVGRPVGRFTRGEGKRRGSSSGDMRAWAGNWPRDVFNKLKVLKMHAN